MKNLKTLLALALSLSMCVSLAACGSSADDDDEDKAEKKTPTSSAAAAEKESDEKTESKAEAEESTAESTADESEATETDTDSSESSLTLNDFEAIAKEIANVSTMEEAEKIVTEKLSVDVSSKYVFEATKDKEGFDAYSIEYALQTPINVFGNIEDVDDPMPPVDKVSISTSTKGSKPISFSFSMAETFEEEQEYFEKNEAYEGVGAKRSEFIKITFFDALDDRYGEHHYTSDYGDGLSYWTPDGLPFSVRDASFQYTDRNFYNITFDYDPYYIEK